MTTTRAHGMGNGKNLGLNSNNALRRAFVSPNIFPLKIDINNHFHKAYALSLKTFNKRWRV